MLWRQKTSPNAKYTEDPRNALSTCSESLPKIAVGLLVRDEKNRRNQTQHQMPSKVA